MRLLSQAEFELLELIRADENTSYCCGVRATPLQIVLAQQLMKRKLIFEVDCERDPNMSHCKTTLMGQLALRLYRSIPR